LGLSKQELKEMEAIGYMKKIQMEVDELNRSPEFHQLFTDEEDQEMIKNSIRLESLEQGIEQGLEQGLEQGRAENLIDKMTIAKNLIHFGMNPNDVSKNTGLSKEIVNNLIHN
jgi:predicted transposase/invertase (TIGR01784 family)